MPALPDSHLSWTPARALELVALCIFVLALAHTFAVKQLERLSRRFPRHAGLFHLLGEVEVVFGFWGIVLVLAIVAMVVMIVFPRDAAPVSSPRSLVRRARPTPLHQGAASD